MNLIAGKDMVEIKDFAVCTTGRNQTIQANKCVVFKEVGVFLYLDDVEVFFGKGSTDKVEWIENHGETIHCHIRFTGSSSESLYLKKTVDESAGKLVNIGDFVFTANERDIAWKLYCVESEQPFTLNELRGEIEQRYMWQIDRFINNRILQVKQQGVTRYVNIQDITTINDILSDVQKQKKANIE